jgi:hypothetical protein
VVPLVVLAAAVILGEPLLFPCAALVLVVLWGLTMIDAAAADGSAVRTGASLAPPDDEVSRRVTRIDAEVARIHDLLRGHDLPLEEIGSEASDVADRAHEVARAARLMIESLRSLDAEEITRRVERDAEAGAADGSQRSLSLALRDQLDAARRLDAHLRSALSLLDCIQASLAAAHAHLVRVSCRPDPEEMRDLVHQMTALRDQAAALGDAAA